MLVNDESYANKLPFVSEHVHVKRATTPFIAVTGFGFHILWDGISTAYITLEPFFMNKVFPSSLVFPLPPAKNKYTTKGH